MQTRITDFDYLSKVINNENVEVGNFGFKTRNISINVNWDWDNEYRPNILMSIANEYIVNDVFPFADGIYDWSETTIWFTFESLENLVKAMQILHLDIMVKCKYDVEVVEEEPNEEVQKVVEEPVEEPEPVEVERDTLTEGLIKAGVLDKNGKLKAQW